MNTRERIEEDFDYSMRNMTHETSIMRVGFRYILDILLDIRELLQEKK